MSYKFKHAVLGGTFDHFHAGHKHFIRAAFERSGKVTIGLTIDEFSRNKLFAYSIEDYKTRETCLKSFLNDNNLSGRYHIIRIKDAYGTSITDRNIDAIFVTSHGLRNAKIINKKRQELGFSNLYIYKVGYLRGPDRKIISSTRIRAGEIDRTGKPYNSLFEKTLTLPASPAGGPTSLKSLTKNTPSGKLIKKTSKLKTAAKNARLIISVGDIVSENLVKIGRQADVSIVDLKTRRGKILNPTALKGETIVVRNDAGSINFQAVKAYIKSLKISGKRVVKVDGEEDLLALPATLLAPLGSLVLYGMPNKGVVVVEVNEEKKEEVSRLLKKLSYLKNAI